MATIRITFEYDVAVPIHEAWLEERRNLSTYKQDEWLQEVCQVAGSEAVGVNRLICVEYIPGPEVLYSRGR